MPMCRDCGQQIIFITMYSGSKMPCDPDFITLGDAEVGDKFITLDGDMYQVTGAEEPRVTELEGHVCHFSTCPKSDLL